MSHIIHTPMQRLRPRPVCAFTRWKSSNNQPPNPPIDPHCLELLNTQIREVPYMDDNQFDNLFQLLRKQPLIVKKQIVPVISEAQRKRKLEFQGATAVAIVSSIAIVALTELPGPIIYLGVLIPWYFYTERSRSTKERYQNIQGELLKSMMTDTKD